MFVINIFERSSFGYVLSNEFVEQFNMGLVCGTIGFGKKDGNTERPLNGSKSHKFRSVIRRYGMHADSSIKCNGVRNEFVAQFNTVETRKVLA
nr:hypothetical protein [Porphyromonas endodontalis]